MAMMMQQQYHQHQVQVQIQAQMQARNLNQSQSDGFPMQTTTTIVSVSPGFHQTNAPKSLANRQEASVVYDEYGEQGHCAMNFPLNEYARTLTKDEMQCPRSNQAPIRFASEKYSVVQSNPEERWTIVWKMDDGRNMIITGSEFSPEDAAKIPKRLRGNTLRGAR